MMIMVRTFTGKSGSYSQVGVSRRLRPLSGNAKGFPTRMVRLSILEVNIRRSRFLELRHLIRIVLDRWCDLDGFTRRETSTSQ